VRRFRAALAGWGIGRRFRQHLHTPSRRWRNRRSGSSSPASPDFRELGPPASPQPRLPEPGQSAQCAIHVDTVRPTEGPFRRTLLGSTISNTPDAHKLAAQIERVDGWSIMLVIAAAKQAGQDWRTAMAAARQRLADDANRLRVRCILRVGSSTTLSARPAWQAIRDGLPPRLA
jgi:hypothetical protein